MKLLIVIPAFNEVESLPAVIDDITSTCPEYDYLIVNDGSSDGTDRLCKENGYNMLDLSINLGLAGAFQAGVLYAAENGYDAVMQFDADGQHKASGVSALVKKMGEGYDIVIGSRFVTVRKPINMRMFGSFLISFAMRIATGKAITDPTSGMRIFNRKILLKFANSLNYPPEPDTISYLIRCGAKVGEVQIETAPRTAGTSFLTPIRSIFYMINTAISILVVQWFRKNDLSQDLSS